MKRNNFIITIILLVLINSAAIISWFYSFSFVNGQNKKNNDLINQIELSDKTREERKELENFVSSLKEKKQKIDKAFLDKQDTIKFIEQLEYISAKTGSNVKIDNINDQEDKNLNMRISVIGSFTQIFHYIVLLENVPQKIKLNNFFLYKQDKENKSGSNQWLGQIDLSVISFLNS